MARRIITLVIVMLLAYGGVAAIVATHSTPELGLDLKGGTSVILRAPDGTDPDVLEKAVEIMRGRIEAFGVQEPEISISGKNGVLVQLPGVTDRERALEAIGQTGVLSFRPVIESFLRSPLLQPATTTTTAPGETTVSSEPTTTTTFPPN
ncbi:MAG TPA: hypothetical protein ENH33_00195, partial [Actinobacteria bacterium]|nr:hypothetical protein [Actinomycetota bacterium]